MRKTNEEKGLLAKLASGVLDGNEEREIMFLLARKPYITAREMSMHIGFSTRKISWIREELHEMGRSFGKILREKAIGK